MTTPAPDRARLEPLAEAIRSATAAGEAIPQLAAPAGLDLAEAYAVQLLGIEARLQAGERLTGLKLGFTSREKAEQMGVFDVILGTLTDAMEVPDGGVLDLTRLIHPRIEPEIAFRLAPGGVIDPATDLRSLVTHVAVAMEVIDSRFQNFSFSLADVVADNTSACRYVVGPWQEIAGRDLAGLDVTLTVDGATAASGSTTAILGDPWEAPAAVQRLASTYGHTLQGGMVLLAGAATAAVPLEAGVTVTAEVAGLGQVSVTTGTG